MSGPKPDDETARLLREDLAIAWQKPSFRAYVKRILETHAHNDPEYRDMARLREYLPTD